MIEWCISRKKSYPTAEQAQAFADFARLRHGTISHVYHCDCGQYHVSTQPQSAHVKIKLTLGERAKVCKS